jgi:sporulation protein YlmC with PRC-barrel domain
LVVDAMLAQICKAITFVAVLCLSLPCSAETRGKVDTELEDIAAECIGAPVFSRDGEEVGEVVDISFDDEGQPLAVRMKTAAHLGFGARIIKVPSGAFIALRGAIRLDVLASTVEALPELVEPDNAN